MNGLHIKSGKVDDSNDAEQIGESCVGAASMCGQDPGVWYAAYMHMQMLGMVTCL